MGEDHKFVTDWLVSQGLDNINLIYLKLVIQNYKSSMYKYYTIFEISLINLRFFNLLEIDLFEISLLHLSLY